MGGDRKLFRCEKMVCVENIPEVDCIVEKPKEKKTSFCSLVKSALTKSSKCTNSKVKAKYQVYHSQKEKIAELLLKVKWMESKQEGKEQRMEEMESKSLTFDEKVHLKALKISSKRLEEEILVVNNELLRRRITINQLGIETKPTSLNTPSLEDKPDFVVPQFLNNRCWEDNSHSVDKLSVLTNPKEAAKAKRCLDLSAAQKDRVYELKEKLGWLENKRSRKLNKILELKNKKQSLSFDQKILLKGLKHSWKSLEKSIVVAKLNISRREETMSKADKLCKSVVT